MLSWQLLGDLRMLKVKLVSEAPTGGLQSTNPYTRGCHPHFSGAEVGFLQGPGANGSNSNDTQVS